MKIAIESPDQLKDTDLEEIVNEWNRRRKEKYLFRFWGFSYWTLKVCIAIYLFVICVFSI